MKRRRAKPPKGNIVELLAVLCAAFIYWKSRNVMLTAGCALLVAFIWYFACGMRRLVQKRHRQKKYLTSSLYRIDHMEGHEFEEYLQAHFQKLGYRCRNVGAGGHDYGVDLLVTKNGETTAVQAKRYREKVGIKAIQEIASGMRYYKADKALVVTNSFFTKSAVEMAAGCGVELWNRDDCRRIFGIVGK